MYEFVQIQVYCLCGCMNLYSLPMVKFVQICTLGVECMCMYTHVSLSNNHKTIMTCVTYYPNSRCIAMNVC